MLNLFVGLDIYTGLLLLLALAFVLFYEAINGFHDTANAVAAVIYTRAMQPQLAVVMAAFFNFFGVLLGGLSVAYAIVHMLPTDLLLNMGSTHGLAMVFSMLLAAIIWNLGTWFFGFSGNAFGSRRTKHRFGQFGKPSMRNSNINYCSSFNITGW
ncbi:hypothetical protein AHIOMGAK_000024 [Escherichia coli]|nr:hypothetical protein [Escherichia coli]